MDSTSTNVYQNGSLQMGVSINGGTQNRWFTMGNPIKIDDLGVPLFQETSKWARDQKCFVEREITSYTNFGGIYVQTMWLRKSKNPSSKWLPIY